MLMSTIKEINRIIEANRGFLLDGMVWKSPLWDDAIEAGSWAMRSQPRENKSRGSEAGTNLECLRNSKTSVNGE